VGVASSLLSVHDEEKPVELEMGWLTEGTNYIFERVPSAILEAAEKEARKALEESDM
jgi:hypothetical protein